MKRIFSSFACIALISGCASAPTQTELDAANYGPAPTADQIQTGVKGFMQSYLKDPDSAKYEFSELEPIKYFVKGTGIATDQKLHVGWKTDVRVNAKNGFGGYTGFQFHQFLFRDGKPVGHNDGSNGWRFW